MNTSNPAFGGAAFPYVAANTVDARERLLLPPYSIVERAGVRVGFIGVTTATTVNYLLPRHAARHRWLDVSESVNRWVPELQRKGVEAIVVLAHSGGVDGAGEIFDEARQMDDAVDVVVAGHTHALLNHWSTASSWCRQVVRHGLRPHPRDRRSQERGDDRKVRRHRVDPAWAGCAPRRAGHLRGALRAPRGAAGRAGRWRGRGELPREGADLGELVADAQRAYAGPTSPS